MQHIQEVVPKASTNNANALSIDGEEPSSAVHERLADRTRSGSTDARRDPEHKERKIAPLRLRGSLSDTARRDCVR